MLELKSNCNQKVIKTVETYLPPINAEVTDFQTIYTYLRYLQNLASVANMPYVNVTLDVGAFKLVWNYSEDFQNVIIHFGDFHFMKENLKVFYGNNFIFQEGKF